MSDWPLRIMTVDLKRPMKRLHDVYERSPTSRIKLLQLTRYPIQILVYNTVVVTLIMAATGQ